ncbi:hypothetical protein [Plantibacter sp. M259]|uniref:hypothetical protein n=1 Tax=Plantibacter sp. M259 TaxID=2583822 RepID=UPI001110DEFC|nr:hypothetical protein [Plantibacter sp. M259]
MNTFFLRAAASVAAAALLLSLSACVPINARPGLTIASTASSAEPAPDASVISELLNQHANASLFPGDGEVTVLTPSGTTLIDLTPMRGDDVENSEEKRAEKIDAKISALDATLRGVADASDGLDVVGVLDRALETTDPGGTTVLITSGLSTVAPMDLTRAGDWVGHPEEFVAATQSGDLPDATGKHVIFAGIGIPNPNGIQPTPGPAARSALKTILLSLCEKMNAASCRIASGESGTHAPKAVNFVPVVEFGDIVTACVGQIALDSTLLFEGESALLAEAADVVLAPIAAALAQCGASTIVDATGYTADTDCDHDPAGSSRLAIDRATAVLDRLLHLGAPTTTIGSPTNGGQLINDCPDGIYDPNLGSVNRTVILSAR